MTTLIFFGILEFLFFDSFWINDTFVRRVNLGPVLTQMHYLDLIFTQSQNNYSFLTGNQDDQYITYRIGETYYKNPSINANTISFLQVFGQLGILGYFFVFALMQQQLAYHISLPETIPSETTQRIFTSILAHALTMLPDDVTVSLHGASLLPIDCTRAIMRYVIVVHHCTTRLYQ
jgi:hypothetical protein